MLLKSIRPRPVSVHKVNLYIFYVLSCRQKQDNPDGAASFSLVSSELQRKDKFMRVLFSCNVRKVGGFFAAITRGNMYVSAYTHTHRQMLCVRACVCLSPAGRLMRSFVFNRSTVSTRQRTAPCSSPTATCTRWTPWGSTNPWRVSPSTTYDTMFLYAANTSRSAGGTFYCRLPQKLHPLDKNP